MKSNGDRSARVLEQEKVNEVKELLAGGKWSQRMISRMTGVSRVVVHRIATGKRKERSERVKEEWDVDWNGKPYRRCSVCGAKVQLPCLACIIRQVVRMTRPARFRDSESFTIALELEEKHHLRYEQIKAWRQSQNDPDFDELPEDWPFHRRRKPLEIKTETNDLR